MTVRHLSRAIVICVRDRIGCRQRCHKPWHAVMIRAEASRLRRLHGIIVASACRDNRIDRIKHMLCRLMHGGVIQAASHDALADDAKNFHALHALRPHGMYHGMLQGAILADNRACDILVTALVMQVLGDCAIHAADKLPERVKQRSIRLALGIPVDYAERLFGYDGRNVSQADRASVCVPSDSHAYGILQVMGEADAVLIRMQRLVWDVVNPRLHRLEARSRSNHERLPVMNGHQASHGGIVRFLINQRGIVRNRDGNVGDGRPDANRPRMD